MYRPVFWSFHDFVASIEWIALLWIAGIVIAGAGTVFWRRSRLAERSIRLRLRNFHRDEGGAAYSLSFVMVLPFYVLLIAVILETTFIMIAKTGTLYAAYGAARSAVVFTTIETPDERESMGNVPYTAEEKASQAAVQAMLLFASGRLGTNSSVSEDEREKADAFLGAYKEYVKGGSQRLKDGYITNKYVYASRNTTTTLEMVGTGELWQNEIRAEVTYDAPFLLPYVGRLLGGVKNDDGQVVLPITSSAVLLNECPVNSTGHLGISYSTVSY